MTQPVVSRGLDRSFDGESWASLKTRFHLTWGACKATEGLSFVDSSFASNWAGLHAAGLGRVTYHFAHPDESAAAQVTHFVSTVRPQPGDALVCDLERGTTQAATNAWTRDFLTRLRKAAPDCGIGLYMGTGYAGTGTGAGLSNYADWWWVARYPGITTWPTDVNPQLNGNTTGWSHPHVWQWSSSFYGGYDANVSTLTAEQLTNPSGADMPLSQADLDAIWAYPLEYPDGAGKSYNAATHLVHANYNGALAQQRLVPLATALAALPQDVADRMVADMTKAVVDVTVAINGTAVTS